MYSAVIQFGEGVKRPEDSNLGARAKSRRIGPGSNLSKERFDILWNNTLQSISARKKGRDNHLNGVKAARGYMRHVERAILCAHTTL